MSKKSGQADAKFELGRVYKAKIRLRPNLGAALRPGVEALDGVVARFFCAGPINDSVDKPVRPIYRNEFAFMPVDGSQIPLPWIAEGDLTAIELEGCL